jgi:hypothetical protein
VKIDRRITKLLNGGRAWCQGHMAITNNGRDCSPIDRAAVAWCLSGALHKIFRTSRAQYKASDRIWLAIKLRVGQQHTIPSWNDTTGRTWAEIESVLKEAGL